MQTKHKIQALQLKGRGQNERSKIQCTMFTRNTLPRKSKRLCWSERGALCEQQAQEGDACLEAGGGCVSLRVPATPSSL